MRTLSTLTLIALFPALTAAQTNAPKQPNMTVLGFDLGGAFTVSECPRTTESSNFIDPKTDELRTLVEYDLVPQMSSDHPKPCFEWPDLDASNPIAAGTAVGTAKIKIEMPIGSMPTIVSRPAIEAQVINGKIESISFDTAGLESQDDVLSALTDKYGPPTVSYDQRKENGFGAIFSSHTASWSLPALHVFFLGMLDQIDEGSVIIETPVGMKFDAQQRAKHNPKL